jgi:hypothetical protein
LSLFLVRLVRGGSTALLTALSGLRVLLAGLLVGAALTALLATLIALTALLAAWIILLSHRFSPCWYSSPVLRNALAAVLFLTIGQRSEQLASKSLSLLASA